MSEFLPGSVSGPVSYQYPQSVFNGIAIIGEAPGADEVQADTPFVGKAGQLLDKILEDAGIDRDNCFIANAFLCRPEKNKIGNYFASRTAARVNKIEINTDLPSFQGGFCRSPHDRDIRALWRELKAVMPRVIVTLGNTPTWAISLQTGITKIAGTQLKTEAVSAPVIPTYHPAYLMRKHSDELNQSCVEHFRKARQISFN